MWVWNPRFGIRDPGSGRNLLRFPDTGSAFRNSAGQTVTLCCRYSLHNLKFLITDPMQASASFKIWDTGSGSVLFCTSDDVYFQAPPEGGRTLPVQLCDGIPPVGDSVRSS